MDGLGQCINIIVIILFVLGIFARPAFYVTGLILMVYQYFRVFSKNRQKRIQENYAYYALRNRITGRFSGVKNRFAQRKIYKFYKCPQCKQQLRVPRGRGKIAISCPKCHTEFIKKS